MCGFVVWLFIVIVVIVLEFLLIVFIYVVKEWIEIGIFLYILLGFLGGSFSF